MRQSRSGSSPSRRGQPLLVYAALIAGWIALRTAWWDSPLRQEVERVPRMATSVGESPASGARGKDVALEPGRMKPVDRSVAGRVAGEPALPFPLPPVDRTPLTHGPAMDREGFAVTAGEEEFARGRTSAGHQLLWLAAMAHLPVPRQLADATDRRARDRHADAWLPLARERNERRWSLDSWLFLRQGSGARPGSSGLRPSYGQSQLGAVLRYRLGEARGRESGLYARYSQALAGPGESEFAGGIAARPIVGLPVRLHAELRATRAGGHTEVRPAALATAGLHRDLGQDVQVRGYGQAGYVGGGFPTAFVDGQLVADRKVAQFDLGRLTGGSLRVGGGAWGGAQKDAARLDMGPSASILVPVTAAPVRLSLDYRFRVAGDAEPQSGVAMTLSTGF